MADFVFHYTSRAAAQSIRIDGRLWPGRGGKLYVTPSVFESGAAAAAQLSILGNPVEVVLAIPAERARDLTAAVPVEPILGEAGQEVRPGGGLEQTTGYDVDGAGIVNWSVQWP